MSRRESSQAQAGQDDTSRKSRGFAGVSLRLFRAINDDPNVSRYDARVPRSSRPTISTNTAACTGRPPELGHRPGLFCAQRHFRRSPTSFPWVDPGQRRGSVTSVATTSCSRWCPGVRPIDTFRWLIRARHMTYSVSVALGAGGRHLPHPPARRALPAGYWSSPAHADITTVDVDKCARRSMAVRHLMQMGYQPASPPSPGPTNIWLPPTDARDLCGLQAMGIARPAGYVQAATGRRGSGTQAMERPPTSRRTGCRLWSPATTWRSARLRLRGGRLGVRDIAGGF